MGRDYTWFAPARPPAAAWTGRRGTAKPASLPRETVLMPLPVLRLILMIGALFAVPSIARAHAILLDSRPAAGAAVKPGRTTITLRYNSRIDAARSRVGLAPQGKAEAALPIAQGGTPDTLTVQADLAPGPYVLRWQVLAIDGHITRGELRFTAAP